MFSNTMTDPTTEAVAGFYHGIRSEAKKQRKRDPLAEQREQFRRAQDQEDDRYSVYPPGWNGEEW